MTKLPAVVSTLEELQQENKQVEVATEATTLLNSVQKCTFLIVALVMQHTSGIILPVSKLLQKKELNIFVVINRLVQGNVIPMGIPWETSHGMG